MSSACLILVGLLLLSPFYDAANIKGVSLHGKVQQQRSLSDLQDMVNTVPGHSSTDFIHYGKFCGLGGSGVPVDDIDKCCQAHDSCYDDVTVGVCKNENGVLINAVYWENYKWKEGDDGSTTCEEDENKCHYAICKCDAVFVDCLKEHITSYDPKQSLFKK